MTIEEATEFMAPTELTEAQIIFAEFMVPITIKGVKMLYGRAYLEIDTVYLDQLIPDSFQVLRWGKVDPDPVTLRDFLLLKPYDLTETTCGITLCSRDQSGSMKLPQPAWRLGAWVQAVAPFGYVMAAFMDQVAWDARKLEVA
jgi:hypothetical protein